MAALVQTGSRLVRLAAGTNTIVFVSPLIAGRASAVATPAAVAARKPRLCIMGFRVLNGFSRGVLPRRRGVGSRPGVGSGSSVAHDRPDRQRLIRTPRRRVGTPRHLPRR